MGKNTLRCISALIKCDLKPLLSIEMLKMPFVYCIKLASYDLHTLKVPGICKKLRTAHKGVQIINFVSVATVIVCCIDNI